MTDLPRYAIYYMPLASSSLWRFGARVLGYDPAAPDGALPQPFAELSELAPAAAVADPARYGFHATLKAPFELANTATEEGLLAAAQAFARQHNAFAMGRLQVVRLHRFIALVPEHPPQALQAFADHCVCDFDQFRAPLRAVDRARRLASPLAPEEIAHLDRWGYPYVFERFQFHMTLSGPLQPDTIGPLHNALVKLYAPISTEMTIDGFAVFKQTARTERFHVLKRFGLEG
jgi:putative phosphonate metabolism protein